jgi:hypothetical protein
LYLRTSQSSRFIQCVLVFHNKKKTCAHEPKVLLGNADGGATQGELYVCDGVAAPIVAQVHDHTTQASMRPSLYQHARTRLHANK